MSIQDISCRLGGKGEKGKSMNFENRVTEWIDRQKDEVVAFLQELVRIPSVTGEEGPIQQFI
jgi:hypothetical protein